MRLKQLAIALLCSGAMIAPALAQTPAPATTTPATTTPATMAPAVKPTTPVATPAAKPMTPPPATTAAAKPATPTPTMAPMGAMTNINTASAADLDKLPQIGKARAAKIIGGRPYKATDDLLTKKVLSKGVYDKIKDKITVG